MKFIPAEVKRIRDGSQRQTRRRVYHRDGYKVPPPARVGESLPLVPGDPEEGHIVVVAVFEEALGEVTWSGASAEGASAGLEMWQCDQVDIYDPEWCVVADRILAVSGATPEELADGQLLDLDVSARTARSRMGQLREAGAIVDPPAGEAAAWVPAPSAEYAARLWRFRHHLAHRTVWTITFRLEYSDTPRFLTRHVSRAGDYTVDEREQIPDCGQALSREELTVAAKDARDIERRNLDWETRAPRTQIGDALEALAGRDDLGESWRKRVANMRRELDRLNREMAA